MAEELANPKPIDNDRIGRWVEMLQTAGVRAEEVRPCAMRFLMSSRFFPSMGEFIEALRPKQDQEAKADVAWQLTLGVVRKCGRTASLSIEDFNGDGVALWTVSRMGWSRFCSQLTEENRTEWRLEFVRTYRAGVSINAWLTYLPGEYEMQNLLAGREVTPSMCGRSWKAFPPSRQDVQALPSGDASLAIPADLLR